MLALTDSVTVRNATLTTDSRRVAEHFGKRHADVLRAIDRLDCSPGYRERNFALTMVEVAGPRGAVRRERSFSMTKDGFVFLVMGFTGKEAARIKEAYIEAFNTMAEQLQQLEHDVFHSYWKQRLELEKRDRTSFDWASFGSRQMHQRRRELPEIHRERARLEAAMQQPLPGVDRPKGLAEAPVLRVVSRGRRASNDASRKRSA